MPASNGPTYARRLIGQRLLVGCLLVLLILCVPATVVAASSDPEAEGPDRCAQCHPAQATTWQGSPHAQAAGTNLQTGTTCETCHGAYVANHPQDGMMQLSVDASMCGECHTTTYQEWHETAHARVDVQCASCHVPHSQEVRLSSEALCESCHRDEAEHWVHHNAGVHCTDCHLSLPSGSDIVTDVRVMAGTQAPDHRFGIAVESCGGCHAQEIHDRAENKEAGRSEVLLVSVMTERAKELATQLEDSQRTNRALQTTSVVSLGFGLGTGGVLGAILVLVVGYIVQGRAKQ